MFIKFIILIILLFSSPAFCQESQWWKDNKIYSLSETQKWDKWDKGLMVSYITSTIIDCLQTRDIFDNPKQFHERNSAIRYGVKKFGKGSIPVYFLLNNVFNYLIADHLKSFDVNIFNTTFHIPTRKIFLIGINCMEYKAISHNYKVGVKLSF